MFIESIIDVGAYEGSPDFERYLLPLLIQCLYGECD